jgi:hypothetical protein
VGTRTAARAGHESLDGVEDVVVSGPSAYVEIARELGVSRAADVLVGARFAACLPVSGDVLDTRQL